MDLRFQCEHLKIIGVNERVSSKDEKFGVLCEFIYQSGWQSPGYDFSSVECIEVW